MLLRTVAEESKAQDRRFWVSLDRPLPMGQVDKWYGQIVLFSFPQLTMWGGRGYVPTEREGDSQVQKISWILTVTRT
jgi:hypothetical protein